MPVGEYLLFAVVLLIASIMHESTCEQNFTFIVRVTTGNEANADTDANVYMVIYGSKGQTREMHLKSSLNTMDSFERGQTDLFNIHVKDIGKIEKIRVRRDNTNKDPSWFLEDVRISIYPADDQLVFRFHRWVKENWEENQKELEPTNSKEFKYYVQVTTGTVSYGDTEANVYLVIYGSKGNTGEIHLKNAVNTTDLFETGQTDYFVLDVEDVGEIKKIKLRHDMENADPYWFLKDVRISTTPNEEPSVFRFHDWIMEGSAEILKTEPTSTKGTTTESSQPSTTTDSSKPSTTTDSSQPSTTTDSRQPSTTTDSSQPKTQTTESTPKSSTTTKVAKYCGIFPPCQNGGTCSDVSDGVGFMGYKCKCPEDFEGTDCSEPKTQTTKLTPKSSTTTKVDTYCSLYSPCKNDGVCIDGIGLMDYQCKCPMGFEGKDCLETTEQKVAKEIVLTDESCKRKVSVGIPQVKYVVTLRCEEGTIFVKSVAYGSGKHWNAWIEQIGKMCDHQTHCKVAAKDDMLDYHFIRAYKRLIIVYECVTKMPSRLAGF